MGSMGDDKTPRKRGKGVEYDYETLGKRMKSVVDDDNVDSFIRLILEGNWDESISVLRKISGTDENAIKSASQEILEHKYFGLVCENKILNAVDTLTNEIVPLDINDRARHEKLCRFLVFPEKDSHVKSSSKKSKLEDHNKKLLDELFKLLALPERRLVDAYHGVIDHAPSERLQVLQEHKDKICFLRFSHSGKYLASSSADCIVIVWEVMLDGRVSLKHTLCGHQKPVSCISWSFSDAQLLTCGLDEVVRRWDIESGQCVHIYEKSGVSLVSCAWSPDAKYIFCGVNDKSVCMWDLEEGKELECWKDSLTSGISDLGISSNEREIIVTSVCKENMIKLFGWESKSEKLIEEDQTVTSFSLSEDGKLLLISLSNGELHLWNIDGFVRQLAKYKGNKCVSRSCIGGMEHAFIASGSEHSQVYIWHRQSGELISKLVGHCGAVNCVNWNPTNPNMLASGSDDCTICIWGGLSQGKMKYHSS
ncbi:hypothetical protein CASFOL_015062 [Castilleja foliolosa]|uniref:CTLH domain-containing protein n=1 Tax=Castilleja foliolosa TaxID=1961234 RepID=A0ABD3DE23_9LAMI